MSADALPDSNWVPLRRVVDLLHHPNFFWSCPGLGVTELKYMDLHIDTRDCACLVKDRNGRQLKPDQLAELEQTLASFKGMFTSMNENREMALLPAEALTALQQVCSAVWTALNDPGTVVAAEMRSTLEGALQKADRLLETGESNAG